MCDSTLGRLVVASLAVLLAAGGPGCSGPGVTPGTPLRRGDPAATQACWQKCSAIKQGHQQELSSLWVRELRPGAVAQIFHATASHLREVDTTNVDPVVIDHVNKAIAGCDTMGDAFGSKGVAALLDEFVPTSASLGLASGWGSGSASASRPRTGAFADMHRTVDETNADLERSEHDTILHVRSTYGMELKPW